MNLQTSSIQVLLGIGILISATHYELPQAFIIPLHLESYITIQLTAIGGYSVPEILKVANRVLKYLPIRFNYYVCFAQI